jgi:ribosomal protein S12 methylthiotransferase
MSNSNATVKLANREITGPSEGTPQKKVGFVSLGCPKNLVDSEVMMGMLTQAGAQLTQHAEDAEVIVVNTCSFIDSAQQESVNTILEMAKHKANGRANKLVVAGCLVERFRDEIQRSIPEVDAVVGTGELEKILAAAGVASPTTDSPFKILTSRPEGDAREAQGRFSRETWDGAIADLPNYLYDETTPRVLATPSHTAYIKIAEGCDHPCTFCIIPQLRGKFRSAASNRVAEAEQLAKRGVRKSPSSGKTRLVTERLRPSGWAPVPSAEAGAIPTCAGSDSIRVSEQITNRLLETIAASDKICSYVDVPLQHSSPSVLKRMKRGGGAEVFLRTIEKMRRIIPGVTLRSSFIVGFPGETEKEFEELCDFVKEAQFDWMGAFGYSDQDGAAAYAQEKKVPAREIERRRKRLMQIQKQISKKRKKALVGKEFDLVLEGTSDETDLLLEGRTPMHAPEIDGKVFVNDFPEGTTPEPGQFYHVEITEAHDYDLVAKIL